MLKIPAIATRITKEVAEQNKKLHPLFAALPISTQEDGLKGAFTVPQIGKKQGMYFQVIISRSETGQELISVMVLPENRLPTNVEVLYVRNLFFDSADIVVNFIPSDAFRLKSLGMTVALWRIDHLRQLPTPDEIGNLGNVKSSYINPSPNIILSAIASYMQANFSKLDKIRLPEGLTHADGTPVPGETTVLVPREGALNQDFVPQTEAEQAFADYFAKNYTAIEGTGFIENDTEQWDLDGTILLPKPEAGNIILRNLWFWEELKRYMAATYDRVSEAYLEDCFFDEERRPGEDRSAEGRYAYVLVPKWAKDLRNGTAREEYEQYAALLDNTVKSGSEPVALPPFLYRDGDAIRVRHPDGVDVKGEDITEEWNRWLSERSR